MLIDGYDIDMTHEDAYSEGKSNLLYIENEKKRIDSERARNEWIKGVQGYKDLSELEQNECAESLTIIALSEDDNRELAIKFINILYPNVEQGKRDIFKSTLESLRGKISSSALDEFFHEVIPIVEGEPHQPDDEAPKSCRKCEIYTICHTYDALMAFSGVSSSSFGEYRQDIIDDIINKVATNCKFHKKLE